MILINCGGNIVNTSIEEQRKAESQLKIFAAMHTAVLTPAKIEFALGGDTLAKLAHNSSFPLVCSNLKATASLRAIRPYALLTGAGKKILVLSLMDPANKSVINDPVIQFTDPVAALQTYTNTIRHDLLLVIAHTNRNQALKWVKQVDGIDIVVPAQQPGISVQPQRCNHARIWYNNTQGKIVSAIDVTFHPDAPHLSAPRNQTVYARRYRDDAAIKEMVAHYKRWRHQYQRDQQEKRRHKALQQRRYAGSRACRRCHYQQYTAWQHTAHATAINTLKQRHSEHDSACLPCHTTGMNQGGFISMQQTPQLVGVQCEACHGTASAHLAAPDNKLPPVNARTCQHCHTRERDPDFDFQRRRQTGTHRPSIKD